MRCVKLVACLLVLASLLLVSCSAEQEEEQQQEQQEVPSVKSQIQKAQSAADAANRATARTDQLSATADGVEGEQDGGNESEPSILGLIDCPDRRWESDVSTIRETPS